jgi:putative SOS response-associated peptidase YedK
MFERYVLPDQTAAEHEFLPGKAWWKFGPRFNVAGGQFVPAIRVHDQSSEGVMLRWGLIPSWFEGTPEGPPKICTDADRVENSQTYREPWQKGQRCILPVAGYYVWQLTPEKYRQPWFVQVKARAVFGIAGVWDRWVSDEDDVIEGCSVITVPPNDLVSQLLGPLAVMPAIVRRKDYSSWLHGTPAAAAEVLKPYKPEWMEAHPVSPRINSTSIDDPSLILRTR